MEKVEGINKVAIIGAGLMGFGIGVDFARAGYETWLYNTREESSRERHGKRTGSPGSVHRSGHDDPRRDGCRLCQAPSHHGYGASCC